MMNSRQRFQQVMAYGQPDRVPLLEEGIRPEVLSAWQAEGLSKYQDLFGHFHFDRREEIDLDLEPRPYPISWPRALSDLPDFESRLNPQSPRRLPAHWPGRHLEWQAQGRLLMLRVHEGFFLSMGVDGWERFLEVMYLLGDDPDLVREMLGLQGRFAAQLTANVLDTVEIDAAIFSEPIGDNSGPLISPQMYADLVLPGYQPVLDVLALHGVETIILRTYANIRPLLPALLERGINCLWAVESPGQGMDYRQLRHTFGPDLRLIGGLDLDALRAGKEAIRQEVQSKVPSLLAEGGYLPLLDGRVRSDVSFESYRYYRQLLEELTGR